ncbi:MAG: ROK family glucokinase [Lachnospiraceae bacterium]|nr:ROK family glucokinase [Lachnospiraceae bacterium]
MSKYIFGVDIGGTTVKIGLFTDAGELKDKWEITTRTDEGGKFILGDIAESVKAKVEEKGISADDIKGIGMGVPGPVKEDGTVIRCANLGWGIFNCAEELSKLTGFKVKAGNDANMAALGEAGFGGGKGYDSVVMVTLGTGVGGGIIIGGRMLYGVNGAGGEIGHITVNEEETVTCGCGRKGCLEQYTSATGIVRLANNALNNTDRPSSLRSVQYVSAKEIFDAAKNGDDLALELIDNFGKTLGKALANIACVVDPDVFVIGGGVSKAGQIIPDTVEKYFKENAFHACKGTKFALAELGNDAGMYGGAFLILSE